MASNLEEETRSYIIVGGPASRDVAIRPGRICGTCLIGREPRVMYLKLHPYPVWICYANHCERQVLDLFGVRRAYSRGRS